MRDRRAALALFLALFSVYSGMAAGEPLRVSLADQGLAPGRTGGTLDMLIGAAEDVRYMTVWGYARLVGLTPDLKLRPDILESVEVEEGRRFLFTLRADHLWSDGVPFTSEDFRYYWEDVANNPDLSPSGPPAALLVEGEAPEVEILDARRIRYSWSRPNPRFLAQLAGPRDPFLYRPAHYLKRFHARYAEGAALAAAVKAANVPNWAALHNRIGDMYRLTNPDLPSLMPWVLTTRPPARRFVFRRNPHYHRVDERGTRLPYIDEVVLTVADERLIGGKTVAGESDLQAKGLSFADISLLKLAERRGSLRVLLWPSSTASALALYPNLNANDPVWRAVLRDARLRQALSLGIDRDTINQSLFLGRGLSQSNGVLPQSPLFSAGRAARNVGYDPAAANALLDAAGLSARDGADLRRLPDGRPMELVVETAGESVEEADILGLIAETWRGLGIKLAIRPLDRTVLRRRVYAGETLMSAFGGTDNGVSTADMSPEPFVPLRQDGLAWPKWGQYFETRGRSGESVDLDWGRALVGAYERWLAAPDGAGRMAAWGEILDIHAREVPIIGIIAGVPQPIALSPALRNVPERGVYGWEPAAFFGIYRPDQFWLEGRG